MKRILQINYIMHIKYLGEFLVLRMHTIKVIYDYSLF